MTCRWLVLAVWIGFTATAAADKKPPPPKPAPPPPVEETDAGSAEEPKLPPHITGPQIVDLGNQSEIDLPDGWMLFERVEAQRIARDTGDPWESVVAQIERRDRGWAIVVEFLDIGYVDDSDANELDAKQLMQSIQDGTREQNEKRKQMGIDELFVDGWSEPPHYDRAVHHLVFGTSNHTSTAKIVNYVTNIVGRNGYLTVTLVASPEELDAAKVEMAAIMRGMRFKPGARYEDHKSGDRDSGIGLTALVLGGAGVAVVKAAKAGIIIKLLLVLKKGIIVIVAGIGALFRWLFVRRKKTDVVADAAPPPEPTSPADPPPPAG
jgi:uncharacterized membrane-anchored protein